MIFGRDTKERESLRGIYTATKINQQPNAWKKAVKQIGEHKEEIRVFIKSVTKHNDYNIILIDAGTSEFVENTTFTYVSKRTNYKTESYATTDIVVASENYLSQTKPTLLTSYGRSRNSPESVDAVDAADEVRGKNLYHLFIACNHEGALSKTMEKRESAYAIDLTPEMRNQSFATTSSFSDTMLATLLCSSLDSLDEIEAELEDVIKVAERVPANNWEFFKDTVGVYGFNRIVYLDANCLRGITQESQLKILELTAGRVATMYDSPVGSRHGPKSIVNDDTLTIVYLSDDPYTCQYEVDPIKEMSPQRRGNKLMVIINKRDEEVAGLVDRVFLFDLDNEREDAFLGSDYIVAAQILVLFKFLLHGITPDNSRPTGKINRVVKDIILYPYTKKWEWRI